MQDPFGSTVIDRATYEDKFGGKGHERTAGQICRSIRDFASQNEDRSVGLYGNWGAGKSSVIEMAKKRLCKGDTKFRFFTFDLWSASSSSFKRSLLEELLDWAVIERSDKSDKFEEQRDKVRDREIVTTSDLKLLLSPFGIFFLCLLPFIPLGYAWLGPESFNEKNRTLELPLVGYELTGWAMAIILFSSLLVAAVLSTGLRWKKKGTLREAASHVMSMASHKEKTNTVTQNVREKDPNEHEFDTLFRDLLELVQDDGSRVVLVFDNIDRLPPAEIAPYWALVRSVFSAPSHKQNEKNRSCLVVVPYAKTAIEAVFKIDKGDHDFFSKTFDVNLRVAPPVLSNVSEFLETNLSKRFGSSLNVMDLSATRKIFEKMISSMPDGVVTPRRVISFVNEIADLMSAWKDEIGLPTVAVYVANRQTIERSPQILQESQSEITSFLRLDPSPTPTKYLAALAYNVDPNLAYQTLLEPDVVRAVRSLDREKLLELERTEGYAQVLQNVIQTNSSEISAEGILPLACLTQSAQRILTDDYLRDQARVDLLASLGQLPKEDSWDENRINALEPLLQFLKGSDLTKVASPIADWLADPIGEKPDFDTGAKWASAAGKAKAILEKHKFGESAEISTFFDTSGTADFALGVASLVEDGELELKSLKSLFASRDLKEAAERSVSVVPESVPAIARGLKEANKFTIGISNAILTAFKVNLCDQMTEEEITYSELVRSFADTYKISSTANIKGSKEVLEELFAHGGFVWHVHRFCQDGSSEDLLAIAHELALNCFSQADYTLRPNQNIGGQYGNFHQSSQWFKESSENTDFFLKTGIDKKIAASMSESGMLILIDLARSNLSLSKLALSVLKASANLEHRQLLFVVDICKREAWLRQNAPKLLLALVADTKDNITPKEMENIDLGLLTPELLKDGLNTNGSGWKKFDDAVSAQLAGFNDEQWKAILTGADNEAKLLKAKIDGLGVKVSAKSSDFFLPFEEHYLGILSDQSGIGVSFGDKLLGLVNKPARKQIARSIAQKFAATSYTPASFGNVATEFPELTKSILESADFTGVSSVVLTKLVATATASELEVLVKHAPSFARNLKSPDDETIREVLTEQYSNEGKRVAIEALAKALSVQMIVNRQGD